MKSTKVILFDLGGVVVRWIGIQALSELTGLSRGKIVEIFKSSKIGNQFERGQCTNDVFIHEFRSAFQLSGSDADLTDLWNSWVQDPYPGVIEAIIELQKTYRVACLSNTNDLHWRHLKAYVDLDSLFDPAYASHEIHEAKPDASCFQYVIQDLGVDPEQIVFLDDLLRNVEAASGAGMQAHAVDPQLGALPVLEKLSLI